jgi:hypothetical protein
MFISDYPKSLDEARAYKYSRWAAQPTGKPYREGCCAMEIYTVFRMFVQCSRKNGKGPAGLYCGQHAKQIPSDS